ncbi:uncharacterized protein L201_003092 [Kwoniella dendrophila CBS 6074]|uniref:SAP domain-containing protein n=1 Tax=Kwoniella dendrophila CBS 6074 TaxID=1295534 RepID=A0AAX4JS04_9TREE
MANTRPYTREELKGLRRANLQNLFKIHNLKGANGTNSVLIDSLVDYFASTQYLSAHPPIPPPSIIEKEKERISSAPISRSQVNGGKLESKYKNVPISRPVKGRAVVPPTKRVASIEERGKTKGISSNQKKPIPGSAPVVISEKPVGERSAAVTSSDSQEPIPIESIQSHSQPEQSDIDIPTQKEQQEQPSLPTPPVSSSSRSPPISLSQVEALLEANDAKWQARLEVLEKNLNDQMEKLRKEMSQLRNHYLSSSTTSVAGPSRAIAGIEGGYARTWSPWEGRSVSQPLAGPSTSTSAGVSPFPILGKRRYPDHPSTSSNLNPQSRSQSESTEDYDNGRDEAKRVRFNGSKPGDNTPLNEQPPSIISITNNNNNSSVPRTPSPQKTSAFGADYFANPSLTPLPAHSTLIPRTPSPSRQGTIPDNSQTPRLPSDWQVNEGDDENGIAEDDSLSELEDDTNDDDDDIGSKQKTPIRSNRGIIPQFSTTPEPSNYRPISPSVERSVSASSERFTPGRIMASSTPSNPPSSISASIEDKSKQRVGHDQLDGGIHLSNVTDLERIDEIDEQSTSTSAKQSRLISPGGQLNFPLIKPIPRLSGLGLPKPSFSSSSSYPQLPPGQITPSLLAPPALISRDSRAESESSLLPPTRTINNHHRIASISTRGPPSPPINRPRSVNSIRRNASTPPRTMFPLNLPEPSLENGTISKERLRSASADYMHVAMHGLEGGEESITHNQLPSSLSNDGNFHQSINDISDKKKKNDTFGDDLDFEDSGDDEMTKNINISNNDSRFNLLPPTPRHRTLLGTERYNDKRFGDIPISFGISSLEDNVNNGVWESPNTTSSR